MAQRPKSGQSWDTVQKELWWWETPCRKCRQAGWSLDFASRPNTEWTTAVGGGVLSTANELGLYFTEPHILAHYSTLSSKLQFKMGDAV